MIQDDDGQIYDEISEVEYKAIVRDRLLRDDFIVEDGAGESGYADNGQDDWLEEGGNPSGDGSDRDTRKSCMFYVTMFLLLSPMAP